MNSCFKSLILTSMLQICRGCMAQSPDPLVMCMTFSDAADKSLMISVRVCDFNARSCVDLFPRFQRLGPGSLSSHPGY